MMQTLRGIWWPNICDAKSAKLAASYGVWASILCAFATLLGILFRVRGLSSNSLVDVFIILLIAWAILKMSRIGSVVGLAWYLCNQIYIWQVLHRQNWVLVALLTLLYVNSIRGTFLYHKYFAKQSNKC